MSDICHSQHNCCLEVEARRASEALLAAALKGADATAETLRQEVERLRAENDRIRAVLADTPENIDSLIGSGCLDEVAARVALAALRARAGLEPTP